MFNYRAIKHYKELWRVEDRAQSGCLQKFEGSSCYQNSAGADSPKSVLEAEDHVSGAEEIHPINVMPHQGRTTPPLTGTHPNCCFEGDLMDKSTVSPPVARQGLA